MRSPDIRPRRVRLRACPLPVRPAAENLTQSRHIQKLFPTNLRQRKVPSEARSGYGRQMAGRAPALALLHPRH